MSKNAKKYSVFISYRRDGGSETAKHLRDTLTARGYDVFLDVESLRSGPFNTALYEVNTIMNCWTPPSTPALGVWPCWG